jgi:hypothetical protein
MNMATAAETMVTNMAVTCARTDDSRAMSSGSSAATERERTKDEAAPPEPRAGQR